MAAPMRSTDFRSIVEPILNECFDGVYDQRVDEWSRVFREEDGIPRNYHEEPVLYGFGAAPQLPDGLAEAPHVHYEVILNGTKVNPVYFFYNDLSPKEYEKVIEKANEENQCLS